MAGTRQATEKQQPTAGEGGGHGGGQSRQASTLHASAPHGAALMGRADRFRSCMHVLNTAPCLMGRAGRPTGRNSDSADASCWALGGMGNSDLAVR